MQLGYASLKGLDHDRMISAVEPVLRAHGVDAVELIWRTDSGGWVLYVTVEKPGTPDPSAGINLDLCADISRDLSAALDVAEVMPAVRYRLEVGSPGIDRALYHPADYARFAGRQAKVKIREPIEGQHVLRGCLKGLDDQGQIILEADGKEHRFASGLVESGRLSFDWQKARGISHSPSSQRRSARRAPQRD